MDNVFDQIGRRLRINRDRLVLDGNEIFRTVVRFNNRPINVAAVRYDIGEGEFGRPIYVGTGRCCYGNVYVVSRVGDTDRKVDPEITTDYVIDGIFAPDLNVYDILPIKRKKSGSGILVSGYGCAGAGVRLIEDPVCREVIPTEEYYSLVKDMRSNRITEMPLISIDPDRERIDLEIYPGRWYNRPGRQRDPSLPSILVNTADEELRYDNEPSLRIDLRPRLKNQGVGMAETLSDYVYRIMRDSTVR